MGPTANHVLLCYFGLRELSIEWLPLGGHHLVNGCLIQFCVHFTNNFWSYFSLWRVQSNANSIENALEYK